MSSETVPVASRSTWVPPGGLLVHVGPHKTGTTTVQEAFAGVRDELAGRGIVYPGPYPADHDAVRARLRTPGGWDDAIAPPSRATWSRLTAQTADVDATVVVSSEALCHAGVRQAAAACEELRPGQPHRAVVTVRPFTEVVPSAWQEYVKAGWATSYETFLQSVLVDGPGAVGPTPTFWRRHDHGAVVKRWATALGAHAVAVIVTDRHDPGRLLDAFEEMLGLDVGVLPRHTASANRSLTVPEIELLRQVNVHLRPVLAWESYNALIRMGALPTLISGRVVPPEEQRLALPPWADEAAQEVGRRSARRIRKHEVTVFGPLRDLRRPGRVSDRRVEAEVVPAEAVRLMAAGMIEAGARRVRRAGGAPRERDASRVALEVSGVADDASLLLAAQALADLARELDGEVPRPAS